MQLDFEALTSEISKLSAINHFGSVAEIDAGVLRVRGLSHKAGLGNRVEIAARSGQILSGEVLRLEPDFVTVLLAGHNQGIALGDRVQLCGSTGIFPSDDWIGRIIDADGNPLDRRSLSRGKTVYPLNTSPLPATTRRGFGGRLETGSKLFNTLLPLVRGQRLGLFAGSGIGKSTLIGQFARNLEADITIIALIGERGRELRDFVEHTLGAQGMARSVIIAATSDRSPLEKRRAAWAAMSVAEYFRDQGKQVLLMVDSITRFAEAHREIALTGGEPATMRGFPPSTSQMIMSLCERAGPGTGTKGDITALFSVLVAGSDMDEPIADITRGVLDGHIVLDRKIAERGRFPAVDVLRSVSRSLPAAASPEENKLIARTRKLLGAYDNAELMIQSGLYTQGSDPLVDQAIIAWPKIDGFFAEPEPADTLASFRDLKNCVSECDGPQGPGERKPDLRQLKTS